MFKFWKVNQKIKSMEKKSQKPPFLCLSQRCGRSGRVNRKAGSAVAPRVTVEPGEEQRHLKGWGFAYSYPAPFSQWFSKSFCTLEICADFVYLIPSAHWVRKRLSFPLDQFFYCSDWQTHSPERSFRYSDGAFKSKRACSYFRRINIPSELERTII